MTPTLLLHIFFMLYLTFLLLTIIVSLFSSNYLSSLQLQTTSNPFLFLFYIKFHIVKYLFPSTRHHRICSLFLPTRDTLSNYSMFAVIMFMLRLSIADLNILISTFFSITFIFLTPVLAAAPDSPHAFYLFFLMRVYI